MSDETPEELSTIWDDEIAAAYGALIPKHQEFLLAYLRCWNGAEAYRQVYNPLADGQVASNSGSRILGINGCQKVLKRFTDTRTEDLLLVKAVFKEAATMAIKPIYAKDADGQPEKVEDIPDYDIRVKAGNHLAKLAKLYDEEAEDPEDAAKRPKKVISFGGVKIELE